MENSNERVLIDVGLSEEQASIYNALLEKGPQKASFLASWSGIKRSLVYKVLDQLVSLGLAEKKGGSGTVAVFSPMHPESLMNILERKEKSINLAKEELSFSLGALSSQFNLIFKKPHVQFYEGENGIKKVVFDTLNSKTEVLSFADNEAVNKYYPDLNKEYVPLRKKAGIKKRLISIDNEYIRELAKNDDPNITERRVIKEEMAFATVMQIYDGKISYITLDPNKSIGVIIEDNSIYEMHKVLFEAFWNKATILPSSQDES